MVAAMAACLVRPWVVVMGFARDRWMATTGVKNLVEWLVDKLAEPLAV